MFEAPSLSDPHYIAFAAYEPDLHAPVTKAMMDAAKEVSFVNRQIRWSKRPALSDQ